MPTPVIIIIIVVGALLLLGLLFSVFFTFLVAYKVYSKTLMRGKLGSWSRKECSEPGNPALETMWKRGLKWSEDDKSYIKIRTNNESCIDDLNIYFKLEDGIINDCCFNSKVILQIMN